MTMNTVVLNYKASNIAKAESKYGANFMVAIDNLGTSISMSDLYFLYQAGGATDEEFDQAMSGGITKAVMPVLEAINNAGFLGIKIDLAELEREMQNATQKMQKELTASHSIGVETKS